MARRRRAVQASWTWGQRFTLVPDRSLHSRMIRARTYRQCRGCKQSMTLLQAFPIVLAWRRRGGQSRWYGYSSGVWRWAR